MNINNHMDDDEIELRPQSSSDQTEDGESSQTETVAGDEQRHEERAAEPPPYPPVFQWAVTVGHRVGRWWTTHVQSVVREQDGLLRDYFSLERTYLAYIRTSNIIASFGVLTVQLFILQRRNAVGIVAAGKVVACISVALAMYTVFVGCRRYFVLQHALQQKRFVSQGPEILALTGASLVGIVVALALVLVF
ncbi:hypothetical protein M432DRAFT_365378 [Thermoascus aurantiacus ATCC 26904]